MLSLFLSAKRTASRFAWPTQEGLSAIIGMGVTNFETKAVYENEKPPSLQTGNHYNSFRAGLTYGSPKDTVKVYKNRTQSYQTNELSFETSPRQLVSYRRNKGRRRARFETNVSIGYLNQRGDGFISFVLISCF